MKINKIKNRGYLFTHNTPEWNLNIHLILGEKNNYIIDTGLGSLNVNPIKEYINNNKPIIVINTHYHWDHIWGNKAFEHCTIISHKLCRELIKEKWDEMMTKNSSYCYGEAEMYLPNLVFDNELYFPEDKIKIFYTPGHTIDSISVLDEEEKILNAGDNIGDTMDELLPSIYSKKELYADTLLKYKNFDFDTCISGHNKVLKKDVIYKILEELVL